MKWAKVAKVDALAAYLGHSRSISKSAGVPEEEAKESLEEQKEKFDWFPKDDSKEKVNA